HATVHVHHGGVVGEVAALPTSALKALAAIAKAVVHAAVEADVRSPVAGVEEEGATAPAPVAGSPEQDDAGRLHPDARNPVVAVGAVRPVAGSPEIAVAGAERLGVDGQWRRRDANRDEDLGM